MKRLMLSTALFGALMTPAMVVPAMAQDIFLAAPAAGDIRASEFIGKRLYASEAPAEMDEYEGAQPDWQDIGEVNDVLLGRDGTVDAVLVDIGGFLGIGERQVAVDMAQIKFVSDSATADNPDDYFLVMTASKATLEAAPAYEDATAMAPATEPAAEAPAATDPAAASAPDAAEAPAAETAPGTDTATATAPSREGFVPAAPEQITAETLTGAPVYDATDAHVGEVSQLVLDANGQVTDAIVDVGGFLGIGEKPVALPLTSVEIVKAAESDEIRVYVSQTKEQLEALPKHEG